MFFGIVKDCLGLDIFPGGELAPVVSLTYVNNTISIVFPIISTVKKTLSRLLLLAVSMGYGVVKPTLGGITSRILLLGLTYFIASGALYLVEHLGNINDFSKKTKLFLVLPVAFLDSCFIIWIFSSLSKTLKKLQLQIRRNMAKLELYRTFTNSLEGSVLLSQLLGLALRYAYSDENMEAFDEEGISLTSSVKATGDPASKLERIGLVDDLEEDKRE